MHKEVHGKGRVSPCVQEKEESTDVCNLQQCPGSRVGAQPLQHGPALAPATSLGSLCGRAGVPVPTSVGRCCPWGLPTQVHQRTPGAACSKTSWPCVGYCQGLFQNLCFFVCVHKGDRKAEKEEFLKSGCGAWCVERCLALLCEERWRKFPRANLCSPWNTRQGFKASP